MECDAIVIASPNQTHIDYLLRLRDYQGYVFCEKPPVTRGEDIARLESDGPNPGRSFFNFTYRFSALSVRLQSAIRRGHLGDLIGFSAIVTHGLAFKLGYATSWRADRLRHRMGVFETLGVHFLDVALTLWELQGVGLATISSESSIMAKTGSASDTSRIRMTMSSGATGDILVSYAAPFIFAVQAVGTNGSFSIHDGEMVIRSPRNTFDEKGFFKQPPEIERTPYDPERDHDAALANAVRYFISHVEAGRRFPVEGYRASLNTCRALVRLDADVPAGIQIRSV